MSDKNIAEQLPNIWSCDDRYGKCRDPYGCHCREITNQHYTITTLRAEVERLTGLLRGASVAHRSASRTVATEMEVSDAYKARAEKAEAELVKVWQHVSCAASLLGDARSNHVAGSATDICWDSNRDQWIASAINLTEGE